VFLDAQYGLSAAVPLAPNGVEGSFHDPKSPGLKWRNRRTGPPVPYWFADPKAIKAGYPVKSANLSMFADRPKHLLERAQRLQAEMLLWMSGRRDSTPPFNGTFLSIIDLYERDPESPYNTEIKPGVQQTYAVYTRRLKAHIGDLRIDHQDGRDLKRWFAQWRTNPDGSDHLPRARLVLAVLKAAISFGVACRHPGCKAFQEVMEEIEFPSPKSRTFAPTAQEIEAARKAAHAAGAPRRCPDHARVLSRATTIASREPQRVHLSFGGRSMNALTTP
jgi:hypothetical protein